MGKLLMSTLLACIFLTGCSNGINEGTNTSQSEKLNQEELKQEESKQEEKGQEETEQKETEQKEEVPVIEKETAATEIKEEYIQKLNAIEEGLADLQGLYDEGTTVSMKAAADETYKRWDTALNDIYSMLKQRLSASEMAELKEKQVAWITYRDETAKAESLEYKGGSMESLQYMATQSRVTKERCYELVELYMK